MAEALTWRFFGYKTEADGEIVQEWFDALSDDERDEVVDVLGYLQHLQIDRWKYPHFEHLGAGLSEIRIKVSTLNLTIRIYGSFGPAGQRFAYTLLYGGNKKVKNDKHGKKEAVRRKQILENGKATVHEFEFAKQPNSEAEKRKAKASPIY
jgi:hypothetical protein